MKKTGSMNRTSRMEKPIKQVAGLLVLGALTLTAHAQSSGASSESSDFMFPSTSFVVSIMSGEMVEGSFGSVQSVGELASQALTFSAETGEDMFITSFTLMKEVIQITVQVSTKGVEAGQDVIEFVLTAPRSAFQTASLASSNGANLISDHARDYRMQYKKTEVQTIQIPVDPIPLQVQPFKVGQEQKLAGHTLTVKGSASQPQPSGQDTSDNKALQLMVLNDLGKQLYGQ